MHQGLANELAIAEASNSKLSNFWQAHLFLLLPHSHLQSNSLAHIVLVLSRFYSYPFPLLFQCIHFKDLERMCRRRYSRSRRFAFGHPFAADERTLLATNSNLPKLFLPISLMTAPYSADMSWQKSTLQLLLARRSLWYFLPLPLYRDSSLLTIYSSEYWRLKTLSSQHQCGLNFLLWPPQQLHHSFVTPTRDVTEIARHLTGHGLRDTLTLLSAVASA